MNRPAPARPRRMLRCAIYTRKSTEEGLEQEFNSLYAQREACEAFIRSQRHEGWTVLPEHYDDGGYSGGTMDRPALQQLLADIATGRIDLPVTYKIDRLTPARPTSAVLRTCKGVTGHPRGHHASSTRSLTLAARITSTAFCAAYLGCTIGPKTRIKMLPTAARISVINPACCGSLRVLRRKLTRVSSGMSAADRAPVEVAPVP